MHLGLESIAGTILYCGMIAAFFASIFWRPYAGLLYIIPLLPLQTVRYKMHAYPMGANAVDLILLAVCIGTWRKGESAFEKTPLNGVLLAYGVYTYLSLWRGMFTIDGDAPLWFSNARLQDWKNYMVLPVLCVIVYSVVRTREEMKWLIVAMSSTVLIMNRSFYSTIKDRDFSHFSYELRSEGAMGYAGVNGFAAFEVQFAGFLMSLYCYETKKSLKAMYLGLAVFCVYCAVFSFSRGAYAALIIGLVFLGVRKHRGLLVLVVAALLSWQTLVPGAVQERIFMTEGENGQLENSAGSRLTLWEDAMQVFKGDPLLGTGFNTYRYMNRVGTYQDTHNLYVKVLVETGTLGIGLFLLLMGKMYTTGARLFRQADSDPFLQSLGLGFACLMVCAFINNLFGDRWIYLQLSGYTFALLGMCLRGLTMIREGTGGPEEPGGRLFGNTRSSAPSTVAASFKS